MKKPFKLKSQGSSFKMIGASPLKLEESYGDNYKANQRRIMKNSKTYKNLSKVLSGTKATGKFIGKRILGGPVGAAWLAYDIGKMHYDLRNPKGTISKYNPEDDVTPSKTKSYNFPINDKKCVSGKCGSSSKVINFNKTFK